MEQVIELPSHIEIDGEYYRCKNCGETTKDFMSMEEGFCDCNKD